jgi:hypothetical protein
MASRNNHGKPKQIRSWIVTLIITMIYDHPYQLIDANHCHLNILFLWHVLTWGEIGLSALFSDIGIASRGTFYHHAPL